MQLDVVLDELGTGKPIELRAEHPRAVTTVANTKFYIKPTITQVKSSKNSKIILFSAPGATGKSALAHYIACKKHAVLWDLSQERIANHSLSGMLVESLGTRLFSEFTGGLITGESVLVIDALDEAEMISGRYALETLLIDLRNMVIDAERATIVLCARTETAHFVTEFFSKERTDSPYSLPISQYEIGFFEETNAKDFLIQKISEKHAITDTVRTCVDAQFTRIGQLLEGNQDTIRSFTGYAPVLEALAISYDDDENTLHLLQKTKDTKNSTEIFATIMDYILDREHKKVVNGFKKRCEKDYPEYQDWDVVYSVKEQIYRIADYLIFGSIDVGAYEMSIPRELQTEYGECLKPFLADHPFIHTFENANGLILDFTGPAFRDYALARLMTIDTNDAYAKEYISTHDQTVRFPSQLFFDFYEYFANGITMPSHYVYLYEAFKSKEVADSISSINVEQVDDIVYCSFSLKKHAKRNEVISSEFQMPPQDEQLYITQISNGYIDIELDVVLGNSSDDALINNTTIKCRKLILESPLVMLTAYKPGETLISCQSGIDSSRCPNAKFDIRTDNDKQIKISIPNIADWFKLYKYNYPLNDESDLDMTRFENAIRSILKYFRKHGKDAPGKHKEFIKNVVIGQNRLKQDVFNFLLRIGVVYEDNVDLSQVKINTEALDKYGLNWASVPQESNKNLEKAFTEYCQEVTQMK